MYQKISFIHLRDEWGHFGKRADSEYMFYSEQVMVTGGEGKKEEVGSIDFA